MISGAAKVFEFLVGSGAVIVPVLLACAFFYIICVLFGAKEDAQGDVIAETNASCAVSERHAGQEDMNAVKNEYCEAESSRIERGAGFAMSFASARIYNEEKVCGYGPRGRALRPEGAAPAPDRRSGSAGVPSRPDHRSSGPGVGGRVVAKVLQLTPLLGSRARARIWREHRLTEDRPETQTKV